MLFLSFELDVDVRALFSVRILFQDISVRCSRRRAQHGNVDDIDRARARVQSSCASRDTNVEFVLFIRVTNDVASQSQRVTPS